MSHKIDGIIACHSEVFHAVLISRLGPRLKIIVNHSVGTDHCDLAGLRALNITVTNTPDVLSDATSEIALLLMLGAARRAVEGERLVRSGEWDFWSPSFMVGKQVTGQRLGIVGMGRVGQVMARNARGLNMDIHYHNQRRLPHALEQDTTYHSTTESLLPFADFLLLHCAATNKTTAIMNRDRLAAMPDGAVLINYSRGTLVDEAALLQAVNRGKLAWAGLDCFVDEPGGNPAFAAHENIFMLPHIGSATRATRDAMGFRALDNLDAFFAGKTPVDLVN